MRTKLSGGNLSMKHFPKEAACRKSQVVLGLCRPWHNHGPAGSCLQLQPPFASLTLSSDFWVSGSCS